MLAHLKSKLIRQKTKPISFSRTGVKKDWILYFSTVDSILLNWLVRKRFIHQFLLWSFQVCKCIQCGRFFPSYLTGDLFISIISSHFIHLQITNEDFPCNCWFSMNNGNRPARLDTFTFSDQQCGLFFYSLPFYEYREVSCSVGWFTRLSIQSHLEGKWFANIIFTKTSIWHFDI